MVAKANPMDLLKNLNPPQRAAVLHGEGPLLVLAGAGSGKTRVIVHRIAHLVRERGVPAPQILAVTFTNKAAGEMRERVQKLVGGEAPLIATFHSTCARILRREIHHLGYDSAFAIYDDKDSGKLLKEVMAGLGLDEKRFPVASLASAIDDCKNRGLAPEDLPADTFTGEVVGRVYAAYQKRLKKCNALDFGDLIMLTVRLFEVHPAVLERYRDQWRWILVDEYQDTNPIQYRLVRLLAGEHRNLCVVGDDDQSIYRWRGADIRNILDFEKDFPGVTTIKLEQNYRSTRNILAAAGAVVARNRGRKAKALWSENPPGDPIVYRRLADEREEARFVCREIERYVRRGGDLRDVAVFYRTNAQSRVMEDALVADGIPYHMVGGMRFYERMEVKDILAYLRVLANPADEVSLKRIINVPARGSAPAPWTRFPNWPSARGSPSSMPWEKRPPADSSPRHPGVRWLLLPQSWRGFSPCATNSPWQSSPPASSKSQATPTGSGRSGPTRPRTGSPTFRNSWLPWKSSSGPAMSGDLLRSWNRWPSSRIWSVAARAASRQRS